MMKTPRTDIASIRLNAEGSGEAFARFCGAIEAAWRLGYDVRLRVVDDPTSDRFGRGTRPLDVYAEAHHYPITPGGAA